MRQTLDNGAGGSYEPYVEWPLVAASLGTQQNLWCYRPAPRTNPLDVSAYSAESPNSETATVGLPALHPLLGRPAGARDSASRRQGYQLVELSLAQAAPRRASWQFCLLVAPIPQVQAVAVDLVDSTWTFVTHIERRDLEVRHRVYQAQREILRRFPALEIDFYVFDLERPVREIESPEPPGGLVFLREPA